MRSPSYLYNRHYPLSLTMRARCFQLSREYFYPLARTPYWYKKAAITARYIATAGATKSLSGFPDGEYVVLQFYTTFGENGLALETITLAKAKDDTWQIADYEAK